jgi:hypothetical protein
LHQSGAKDALEKDFRLSYICESMDLKNIFFVGVPHLATYIFLNFQIEPKLSIGIDPGIALNPFPSSIFDETRF